MIRGFLVLLHRYLGLATAVFLAVAGLTGSILAFHHEIDAWLNPEFYSAPGEGMPLGLVALAERAQADHPQLDIIYVEVGDEPGHPALAVGEARPDPQTGAYPELDYNWAYLDPVTGETLATRYWARCCFAAEDFIPFIYEFHHTLTLPGVWGYLLMGVVAICWTLDCFIALVLTFPRGQGFFSGGFFAKWKVAWQVKRGGGSYRTNLDLHRAGGLWLWLILLPVAVSSIAMNLPDQVFRPVVNLFSPVEQSVYYQRGFWTTEQIGAKGQSYADIFAKGQAAARKQGLDKPIYGLYYNTLYNYYAVGYGSHDGETLGSPWFYFDGGDGGLLRADIPGTGTAGEIFEQLQLPIHGGRIAGFAGRVVICVTGVVIFMLSVTGSVIWWKKRVARRHRAGRTAQGVLPNAESVAGE
ncbi:MAG: PepSY-associated TM helix domain-containing protein [Kiloniellaceae bacterium]